MACSEPSHCLLLGQSCLEQKVVKEPTNRSMNTERQIILQIAGKMVPLDVPATEFSSTDGSLEVSRLFQLVTDRQGIPSHLLRLCEGTRELKSGQTLSLDHLMAMPVVRVLLAIAGGKGGFGAMLRNLGKNIDTKNMNYDACRDLSGRRLRHVNNEKQLRDWYHQQEDRDKEAAEQKQESKRKLREQKGELMRQYIDHETSTLVEETNDFTEGMGDALLMGIKAKKAKKARLEQTNNELTDPSDSQPGKMATNLDPTNSEAAASSPAKRLREEPTAGADGELPAEEVAAKKPKVDEPAAPPEPIDLQSLNSEEDLIQLGPDALGAECKRRGLKAGGRVQERAARLWTIRGPPELTGNDVPIKLRAAKPKK